MELPDTIKELLFNYMNTLERECKILNKADFTFKDQAYRDNIITGLKVKREEINKIKNILTN